MTLPSIRSINKWIASLAFEWKAEYVFLFAASFIGECVLSVDTIMTAHGYWLAAGGTTLAYEFLTFVVLYSVLSDTKKRSWPKFLSAAMGACFGAMVAVALAT